MAKRDLAKEFVAYHAANPDMWAAYCMFMQEAFKHNKRISIGMIAERIRWESFVTSTGGYKVQNSFRSYYARLLMWKYPKYRQCFSLKRIDVDSNADLHDVSTWNKFYWSQF